MHAAAVHANQPPYIRITTSWPQATAPHTGSSSDFLRGTYNGNDDVYCTTAPNEPERTPVWMQAPQSSQTCVLFACHHLLRIFRASLADLGLGVPCACVCVLLNPQLSTMSGKVGLLAKGVANCNSGPLPGRHGPRKSSLEREASFFKRATNRATRSRERRR